MARAKILNGMLDWVYEEEIYGRGEQRAYWWSPDSSRLAFLRLDDTPVPTYRRSSTTSRTSRTSSGGTTRRPATRNPLVTLGVVAAGGGPVAWVDTRQVSGRGSPDRRRRLDAGQPARASIEVQNRMQTWLDLNVADAAIRRVARTLLRETSRRGSIRRRRAADLAAATDRSSG